MTLETLSLQGHSSFSGSMVSNIPSRVHEIRKESIKECFSDFLNIEHRLEHIANVHGIEFINDSKATNVNITWFALECMTRPVIWIAGGAETGNDYSILMNLIRKKVKAIIYLGADNRSISKVFESLEIPHAETTNMQEAVELAYYAGKIGDVILFSPSCASFDLFENYEERGNQFKQAVRSL
jgi:UDP-N-acetylmuramoylalanine--D-glutamate ligase